MHPPAASFIAPRSPLAPPVASLRYAALDRDLQGLIFLSFLWRLGACLLAIAGPLLALHWGFRHCAALASPSALLAIHIGERVGCFGALLAALALAFRWHHQSTFGPYEIQFISRGGADLYPKA